MSGCYILFGCTDEGRDLNVSQSFPDLGSYVSNAGVIVKNDYYDLSNYERLARQNYYMDDSDIDMEEGLYDRRIVIAS